MNCGNTFIIIEHMWEERVIWALIQKKTRNKKQKTGSRGEVWDTMVFERRERGKKAELKSEKKREGFES